VHRLPVPRRFEIVMMFVAALVCPALANQLTGPTQISAPPISACQSLREEGLGSWDDAFNYATQDFMVFRRGPELFSHSLISSGAPRRLATTPALVDSKIVNGVEANGHQWLFIQSPATMPYGLDLVTRRQVAFPIPGARISAGHTIAIQSSVMAAHVGGAVLMLEGGDPRWWPRPENRPVYYWFGLESGRAIQLPIGWDLLWFSADYKTAVFWKAYGEKVAPGAPEFVGRPVAAVSMSSGQLGDAVPDPYRSFVSPFDWGYRDEAKPLQAPYQPKTGQTAYFAGISANGVPHPTKMNLASYAQHAAIQADGDWAVFSLRPEGATRSSTLWWARFGGAEEPQLLAADPGEFEILGKRRVVYVTSRDGINTTSSDAFVYDVETGRYWNILDDIERLPRLDPDIAQKGYVADTMRVRLIRGFGSSQYAAAVLSLFSHFRLDLRSNVPSVRVSPAEQDLTQRWARAFVLSGQGTRCGLEIATPDSSASLWLHNSGKLLIARPDWSGGAKKLRVSEIAFAP
jgi:hypothetical protein